MTGSIIDYTRQRCPELGEFLENCCATPLAFEGDHPNGHSADNHIHLWALEWWADHHNWIDLAYRVEFVEEIFKRWRGRLTGLPPYHAAGYRFYLYEDLAPTVSVVAETPFGFPYPGEPNFVGSIRDIMEIYLTRSWIKNFECEPWEIDEKRILKTVEKNAGSISKPTASALGLQVGKLRTLIEQMGLDDQVNQIRKRHKRRPAKFRDEDNWTHEYRVYEQRLPAGYR